MFFVVVVVVDSGEELADRGGRSYDSESGMAEEVNLNNNVSARSVSSLLFFLALKLLCSKLNFPPKNRIRNPLADIPRDELMAQVDQFAAEVDMVDIAPMLRKGALVAQDPTAFETLTELDEDEKIALREEITHKWKQPFALYLTIVLASVAAAVQSVELLLPSLFEWP